MTTLANLTTYISGESQSFLTTVEKTRGGLRALIASLDPVAAATAKYNRQVDILDKGLKNNSLTLAQHATLTQRLSQRYQEQIRGQTSVIQSNNAQRASMQNLGFQVQDFAVQVVGGTSALRAFAVQFPQAAGALTGFEGKLGAVGKFLNGPWGIALTLGTTLLAGFASELGENADAAGAAELANDGLSDAQAALGKMFDLTTGKLKTQNEQLRLNAQFTAANLRAEATAARSRAQSAAQGADIGVLDRLTLMLSRNAPSAAVAQQVGGRVRNAIEGVLSGRLRGDLVQANTQLRGQAAAVGITGAEFDAAIKDAVEARLKSTTADEITKALDTGKLPASLMQEGRQEREREPKVDTTWADIERYGRNIGLELKPLKTDFANPVDSIDAALAKSDATRKSRLDQLNQDISDRLDRPLQRLRANINATAGDADRAFEEVAANGLDSLSDGLTDLITGTGSVSDAFGRMADGIIADLARIAVQRSITGPLADALSNSSGGLSGLFGGGGFRLTETAIAPSPYKLSGSLPATNLPGFATGGSFRIGGASGVDRNLLSINGAPAAMVSRDEIISVSNDNVEQSGGVTINQTFAPNLAGNAVDRSEMVRFAAIVKQDTLATFKDMQGRR
ncbi:phage tail tape measure C-terminal domain-containing protein [Sphingomonas sp.]|uniref:phage tail tape measure C-terminal domain-containing protein n=1 Tax=Sphingomonas sp. TaxID=28214 RepID=UPI003B3A1B7C